MAALTVLIWPATKLQADTADTSELSSAQQAAQDELSSLTPESFYNELSYNPAPLKSQVNLKKPENMDRVKINKDSKEELVIKRALSQDKKSKSKKKAENPKETAASAGDQAPSLMDVPLAPGATLNMGYRYLDYNKMGDSGIPFSTSNVPKADYYGKTPEGHDSTAHEISFGVKVELK